MKPNDDSSEGSESTPPLANIPLQVIPNELPVECLGSYRKEMAQRRAAFLIAKGPTPDCACAYCYILARERSDRDKGDMDGVLSRERDIKSLLWADDVMTMMRSIQRETLTPIASRLVKYDHPVTQSVAESLLIIREAITQLEECQQRINTHAQENGYSIKAPNPAPTHGVSKS